jgi:isopentenyl diphosphate isomerase/L-lactate dehydrogenase-like FMN-dependent dehydrogenase
MTIAVTEDEPATIFQYLARAKAKLTPGAWDYLMGGSETETTLNRNRRALDSLAFRPRILRDVSDIDLRTTLFGIPMRIPVMLAPIGSIEDIVAEGGTAPTRAAAGFGTIHMLSSSALPGLEAVAKEVDHPKFFQLYVRGDSDWVDTTIKRAVDNGFRGIAITVDRAQYSRRERDLAKGHAPTTRRSAPTGFHQASLSWKDIERIRRNIDVPLMLKGVATVEDAMLGVEHGVDGIYISNHGGRQLDHSEGSVGLVAGIAHAVGRRAQIIVDGSILRGTDVVKALCLGARAVAIGRLQGVALGAGGDKALVRVLEILELEMMSCMGLLGAKSLAELGPHFLAKAEPLPRRNWIEAAFPLLAEGYGSGDPDLCLKLPGEG